MPKKKRFKSNIYSPNKDDDTHDDVLMHSKNSRSYQAKQHFSESAPAEMAAQDTPSKLNTERRKIKRNFSKKPEKKDIIKIGGGKFSGYSVVNNDLKTCADMMTPQPYLVHPSLFNGLEPDKLNFPKIS